MGTRRLLMLCLGVAVLLSMALMARVGGGTADAQGLTVTVSLSKPTNGAFLVAGERAEVTVTLNDSAGTALTRDSFATLNLYLYGPQETAKTVTAPMLNAEMDRSKTPHHYINLLDNPNVQASGNVLKYALRPVTTEEAGTYTASVWAVRKGEPSRDTQMFAFYDVQVGTAAVDKQIVEPGKCAACHQGAANGQFYLHHVDPGRSPFGSPAIDSYPVRSCKACHNNNGYAAYAGNELNPTGPTTVRTADPIVRRVHGVHMGEELKNPFNIDPASGNFKAYTGVVFPANVKNCATCHVDERWKTQVSRQACTACHDNLWFGDTAATPAKFVNHPGGPQANDAGCATCHSADSGALSVAEAHKVSQKVNEVAVSLTPPANGKFYVAGEKPSVTLVIKDNAGNPIDHTSVDNANFSTAGLFVYGPREQSQPVLTNAAKNGNENFRASASNSIAAPGTTTKGWTFAAGDTFKIAVNGDSPVVLDAPAGLQTPAQVRDWLAANLSGVTVSATATNVTIRSNNRGAKSRIEFYDSPVTKIMGWKPGPLPLARGGTTAGTTMEPYVVIAQGSYPINDLRKLSDPRDYVDPAVTRSAGNITYQLNEVKGIDPGTYMIYAWIQPVAGKSASFSQPAIGFMTFQVGTDKPDALVATNCTQCHGNTIWHLDEGPQHPEPFDPDYCKACHDYGRSATGDSFSRLGGSSLSGWSGFGAVPISRRVHGVHFGRYLDFPEQIYAGNPNAFNEVIFPQDVRNCTKCHDPKGSAAWKEQPSRLACNACHDSTIANAHAKQMTEIPDRADPWSGDRVETCTVCHAAGKAFAVDKVHNISDPYKPPYPREP
ncbi:MAG: multiheme c-type cytochrome [Chloroflexota bacterium]